MTAHLPARNLIILQMQKKNYPLSLLKDIDKILKELRKAAFENEDIVEIADDDKCVICVRDKEYHLFDFCVKNPGQSSDHRSLFNLSHMPSSDKTRDKISFTSEADFIINRFYYWLELLKQYNTINLSQEDSISKEYEDEFYSEFEIVDEDAYTKPFQHKKQIALYEFLSCLETGLKIKESENPAIRDIVIENQNLKATIQNLTKKQAIRSLARIFAKIKKFGLKFFQEVLSEARKETIKRALGGGFEEIGGWINNIT